MRQWRQEHENSTCYQSGVEDNILIAELRVMGMFKFDGKVAKIGCDNGRQPLFGQLEHRNGKVPYSL